MQAGREVRIMVKPEQVDDVLAYKIARDMKEKIESEMQYPGTIKVLVIVKQEHKKKQNKSHLKMIFLIQQKSYKEKRNIEAKKNFVKMKLTKIKEVLRMKKNYLGGGVI